MSTYLKNLNSPQDAAVQHTEGPLLVLAGAGTGKTRVLTTRIAHILSEGLAQPQEIMAVTFTNKAAREMVERIEAMVGYSSAGMWLGTFHAIGARILRMYTEAADLDPNFAILNTDDQKRVADQLLKDMNMDTSRYPARMLVSAISGWKDNAWTPADLPQDEQGLFGGKAAQLYAGYQKRLKALNAVDFGDLLLKCLLLFKDNPDILKRFQTQFKYILVDEYQDTNAVQYLWLRLLAMAHKNICVVGDDDQSIYAWRGAQVGNILKFEKDFPGAKVVRLEQNYRSTANILKAASELISHNSERHDKTLWTEGGDGDKIEVHPVFDDQEEARMVSDRVESHVRDGGHYEDCAALVRTAAQTRSLEERLIKAGIPYQVIGGLRFYERKENRDAVAYLRLIYADSDNLAFERIINVPKRGIGDATVKQLQQLAAERGISHFQATKFAVENGLVGARAKNSLRAFVEKIEYLRTMMNSKSPDELMEIILEESGYMEMLREDKNKEEARGRMDNLKELVRAMQEYADITSFLEHVSLVMDRDMDVPDTVKLMTVHGAKGLEFDTVFLPGFEDGLFPHQRALDEEGQKGLEEERRLAYVAITRAKRKLIISYASSRRLYGGWQPAVASRFLDELPSECIKTVAATGGGGHVRFRPQVGSTFEKKWQGGGFGSRPEPMLNVNPLEGIDTGDYSIGDRVFHQKFGYGRILKAEGKGEQQRLTINFDKAGSKKLVASMAKLEVVS